jgi:hypothetical protein
MPYAPKWKKQEETKREIGNRREMEDSKSVPVGSPVAQNEPPVPIGCQTQQNEPIGDKNRTISTALNRAGFAGLGKNRGEKW